MLAVVVRSSGASYRQSAVIDGQCSIATAAARRARALVSWDAARPRSERAMDTSPMDTSPSQTPPHRHASRAADAVLRSHTPTSQFGKSALVGSASAGSAFAPPS